LVWIAAIRGAGFAWIWPVYLKAALIAGFALLGLTIGPRWLFACLAWSAFAILYVIPIILFKRLSKAIFELDGDQLAFLANWFRLFNWGRQGRFLHDTTKSLSLYLDGDQNAAETILNGWLQDKLPLSVRTQINDTQLQGYLWTKDWSHIINKYESLKQNGHNISNRLALYASRAYSECGQFIQAAQCLNEINEPKSTNEIYSLSATLLPFYCLSGAKIETEQLLRLMANYKYNLPDYIKNYWLGRLALAQNNSTQADYYFDAALSKAPKLPSWQKRIGDKKGQLPSPVSTDHNSVVSVEPLLQNLKSSMAAQELISPKSGYLAVISLIAIIILVFFLANSYSLFPNRVTSIIELSCYNYGILVPSNVLSGEYWRLLTFLFLHAHLMHVLLNVMALFWLGKIVERVYGLGNFLLIYFISGIMSGIISIAFSPNLSAIGASGAIMGIFGAVGTGIFRLKNTLPESIRRKQLTLMTSLLVFQLIIDQIIPHIDAGAHLGGLITGIALGLLLPIDVEKKCYQI